MCQQALQKACFDYTLVSDSESARLVAVHLIIIAIMHQHAKQFYTIHFKRIQTEHVICRPSSHQAGYFSTEPALLFSTLAQARSLMDLQILHNYPC